MRDGSGNYALPAGNPVVFGTDIDPNWANTTLSDVQTALTNSFARNGEAPATGNWNLAGFNISNVGTLSATTLSATSLTLATLTVTGLLSAGGLNVTAATLPANGLYLPGANRLAAATNTVKRAEIDANGNMVLGTGTPQAWSTTVFKHLSIGDNALIGIAGRRDTSDQIWITSNLYFDNGSVFRAIQNGAAGYIQIISGAYSYQSFATVTAGNTFTPVSRFSIAAAGNVTVSAPDSGTALLVTAVNGALQRSVSAGVFGATNNPRIDMLHTESTAFSALDFTGSSVAGGAEFRLGGTSFLGVASTRALSMPAPSSGATLSVTATAAGSGIVAGDGTVVAYVIGFQGTVSRFGSSTNHGVALVTNDTNRLTIANSGAVSIATPASGTALTANGAAGTSNVATFIADAGQAAATTVFGGGTNNAVLVLGNVTNSERARITGDNSRNILFSIDGGATSALVINGTLSGKATFNAGAYTAASALAFSATPTFNANLSNYFDFGTITANVTSMTISNPHAGQCIAIRLKQNGAGGFTVAVPAGAKVAGSNSGTANQISLLSLSYNGTDSRWEGAFSTWV